MGADCPTPLNFPGATLDRGPGHYLLRLERPVEFLSSALLGEGFVKARWVYSQQVRADDPLPHPERSLLEGANRLSIPQGETFIGLLTAVEHRDLQLVTLDDSGVSVMALATVGVERGSGPLQKDVSSYGEPLGHHASPDFSADTINVLVLVDACLTPGALARVSTMIAEAKALALVEAGVKTRDGHQATGTPTDVTVVGHSGMGSRFRHAGSATAVGWLVSQAAYHCVKHGLAAYNKRKLPQ